MRGYPQFSFWIQQQQQFHFSKYRTYCADPKIAKLIEAGQSFTLAKDSGFPHSHNLCKNTPVLGGTVLKYDQHSIFMVKKHQRRLGPHGWRIFLIRFYFWAPITTNAKNEIDQLEMEAKSCSIPTVGKKS